MSAWKNRHNPDRHRRGQVALAIVLTVGLLVTAGVSWAVYRYALQGVSVETAVIEELQSVETLQDDNDEEPEEEMLPGPDEVEPPFDAIALQQVVDTWAGSVRGQVSVVVSDVDGNVLASVQPDRDYFAASIYKLYAAYAGYQQLDAGEVDPDEQYINGHTRQECIDLMIRESDSPCAEKLWVEIGKSELDQQMAAYGLVDTDMVNIRTSAADAARMLSRIARSEGLTARSQQLFLESMRTQVYRDALNRGFSDSVTVYNKIGFNELDEYHDVAIIQLEDGRQLVVSVLTSRVGTRNIARLAIELEKAL